MSIFDEFVDDDGVVRGDVGSSFKFVFEVFLVVNDSYSSIRKDVIGMNKDRVVDFLGKFFGSFDGG